jgi:hypothetical protein
MPREAYVFSQFLRLLPRYEFQRIVDKYNGDYRTKQFKCWDQLNCILFAHIRQEKSLRDIDIALNAHATKLYHIGIQQCPKSTLADANERRDYRIYEEFAKTLMQHARREYAGTSLALDVDNAVYALDASVIDLTLSLFPWAKFRKTKGAIKLHAMIDLRGNIPAFLTILSLESGCTRVILVPLRTDAFHQELTCFTNWYNQNRPHSSLNGKTPNEVYHNVLPACERPRYEPRGRWPRSAWPRSAAPCASPHAPVAGHCGAPIRLDVRYHWGRKHLPIVELRRAT